MSDSSRRPPGDGVSDGSYVVVARRYRPRGFDELVGQEHVGRALCNAIETNRVGHAYLFTGARGVGKTSTARIFAKALNDPSGPTPTPDNTTDVAAAIDSGEDVDVIEIDGASNRGIDEIRTLRSNVGVRPSRSRYKIYIIDEVHMLTGAAFNALLKTLEEPPEHVKFIFCTTDPEKIPITVLSRCQRFDFAPVEVGKIVDRLRDIVQAESAEADDDALELIARRAAGSMRDSQSLLEQVLSFSDGRLSADQVHTMLGTANDERLHALAIAMAKRDAAESLRQLDVAIDAGVDAGRMAEQLLGYFRDLMTVAVGCDPSMLRHSAAPRYDELKQLAGTWGLQTVLAVVGLVDQTLVRIRHSVHGRVLLEAALIQICHLPDLQRLADLAGAAGVASGEKPAADEKKNAPLKPPHFDRRGAGESALQKACTPESAAAVAASAAAVTENPAPAAAQSSPLPKPASPVSELASPVSELASPVSEPASPVSEPASPVSEPVSQRQPAAATTAEDISDWDSRRLDSLWSEARGRLEAMTETLARAVTRVEPAGSGRLRLLFPAESALAYQRCDLPEHKSALIEAVSAAAGQPIGLDFKLLPAKPRPTAKEPPVNRPSRVQRMREIESNRLIKSCVDLFEAEIVRVDRPH